MIHIVSKPTDTPGDDSTLAVIKELEKIGAEFQILDLEGVDPFSGEIKGEIIWVCGMKQEMIPFEILSALALHNRVINSPESIAICASKAQTTARLLKDGVETPKTVFTGSRDVAEKFLSIYKKIVSKPLYGYDGKGIFPVTSPDQLGENPYYLQEYVENRCDYRVFVIGDEAVGAIRRTSDGFAHNIHQGGRGEAVPVTPKMASVAVAAAKSIGIDYCGVDLLERAGGYTVLEVNGTPNWHCMSAPIPALLARFLYNCDKKTK